MGPLNELTAFHQACLTPALSERSSINFHSSSNDPGVVSLPKNTKNKEERKGHDLLHQHKGAGAPTADQTRLFPELRAGASADGQEALRRRPSDSPAHLHDRSLRWTKDEWGDRISTRQKGSEGEKSKRVGVLPQK